MSETLSTRKPVLRELGEVIWLSLPIIITMTSHAFMQSVDALMLGRHSSDEMAAVSPAGMLYFIFAAALIGLISCNNTFVSQSIGRGEFKECSRYTVHAIYIAVMVQPLVIPLIIWSDSIFALLPHEQHIQVLESSYFRIRLMQLTSAGTVIALSSFFQASGKPVIPMITGIIANALNILGDYILIFGNWGFPEMGIRGAAWATTACSYVEAAMLCGIFLSSVYNKKYETRRWLPVDFHRIWRLLRIGIPSGTNHALDIVSWSVYVTIVLGRLGTTVLAGFTAAMQILHLPFMLTIGLSIGVTALVGRYVGRKDIAGAKRQAYLGMGIACSYMTVLVVTTVIFRRPLLQLFSEKPEVIRVGSIIIMYFALFQFSEALGMISRAALQGAGDTKFPAIALPLVAFLFFLPLGFYIGRQDVWGLHGCWIATTAYAWIVNAILLWRFISERWRKIDIFK